MFNSYTMACSGKTLPSEISMVDIGPAKTCAPKFYTILNMHTSACRIKLLLKAPTKRVLIQHFLFSEN